MEIGGTAADSSTNDASNVATGFRNGSLKSAAAFWEDFSRWYRDVLPGKKEKAQKSNCLIEMVEMQILVRRGRRSVVAYLHTPVGPFARISVTNDTPSVKFSARRYDWVWNVRSHDITVTPSELPGSDYPVSLPQCL